MENIVLFFQNAWLPLIISMIGAYLLGSLNFGIIVTKLLVGEDIREKGSGNAGATNVLRSHGKKLALLTTIGDLAKCIAAVLLSRLVVFPILFDCGQYAEYGAYLAGFFCIIGHLYPLYFGFRGGKGVMTTLGMMLALDWQIALICLALFIVLVVIWRMVSLGSCMAATLLPIATFVKLKFITKVDESELLFCTAMCVLIGAVLIVKHKSNIKRILNGTESKLGSKK